MPRVGLRYNQEVRLRIPSILAATLTTMAPALCMASEPSPGGDGHGRPDSEPASDARFDEWSIRGFRSLELAASLGYFRRLNEPAFFDAIERDALGLGVGASAFLARRIALTLAWDRFGLGAESSGVTAFGVAHVRRRADAAWVGLRMDPWSNRWLTTSVGIGAGMAWQHASASGALWPALQPGLATPVVCAGTGSPSPTIRVDLGASSQLGSGLSVFAAAGFGVFAFGDGSVGTCVSGAGSTEMLSLRTGFAYAFDFGGGGD